MSTGSSAHHRSVRVAPHAKMLIESMRDIGYSLDSALADVIDNSITAGAKEISLFADTSSKSPCLAIIDDGRGMSQEELVEAMRPGARSPLETRDNQDLGRFGLGLKTASFSQCRRLTVVSKHADGVAAACWDLDLVAELNDWIVQIPDDPESLPWVSKIPPKGTLVLWEKLDRLADGDSVEESSQQLVQKLSDATSHLELVFHRFLAGEKGLKKVAISLNSRNLEAFDPFHSDHPATIAGPIERIKVHHHEVTVQSFTLPHHKKVTPDEWEKYGGRAGYARNQGFYVYRAKRLIIHGTWFGLARQTELTKLARVRIDMPNELDDAWKIDVRKSSAHPPRHVKERLRRVIESIGASSKRVFTHRGRRLVEAGRVPVWQRVQDKGEIRYQLNRDHPVVADFVSRLDEKMKRSFEQILELTGAGLPLDALFADIGSQPDCVSGQAMSPDTYEQTVATTYLHLISKGLAPEDVVDMLKVNEPFRSNWPTTESILAKLGRERSGDA